MPRWCGEQHSYKFEVVLPPSGRRAYLNCCGSVLEQEENLPRQLSMDITARRAAASTTTTVVHMCSSPPDPDPDPGPTARTGQTSSTPGLSATTSLSKVDGRHVRPIWVRNLELLPQSLQPIGHTSRHSLLFLPRGRPRSRSSQPVEVVAVFSSSSASLRTARSNATGIATLRRGVCAVHISAKLAAAGGLFAMSVDVRLHVCSGIFTRCRTRQGIFMLGWVLPRPSSTFRRPSVHPNGGAAGVSLSTHFIMQVPEVRPPAELCRSHELFDRKVGDRRDTGCFNW